jgi:hypothetical protein
VCAVARCRGWDIAGLTALTQAHGDEEAAILVAQFSGAVNAARAATTDKRSAGYFTGSLHDE